MLVNWDAEKIIWDRVFGKEGMNVSLGRWVLWVVWVVWVWGVEDSGKLEYRKVGVGGVRAQGGDPASLGIEGLMGYT